MGRPGAPETKSRREEERRRAGGAEATGTEGRRRRLPEARLGIPIAATSRTAGVAALGSLRPRTGRPGRPSCLSTHGAFRLLCRVGEGSFIQQASWALKQKGATVEQNGLGSLQSGFSQVGLPKAESCGSRRSEQKKTLQVLEGACTRVGRWEGS